MRFAIKKIAVLLLILLLPATVWATDFSGSNFTVKDPVISAGSQSSTSTNFGLGQSVSQAAIGKSTSTSFQLLAGFQYYFKANANVLTATPGNGQVSLSWTVPQTFLGAQVSAYEVGIGTVSGSLTYSSVGNVTNYTASSLNNGTAYYFKIKAKTAAGVVLTYSNEASATPSGASPTPSGGGGGGGGGYSGGVVFSGLTSPGADVNLLQNSQRVQTAKADSSGKFTLVEPGLPPGVYNYLIYSQDIEGGLSSFITLQVTVGSGLSQTSNLLLSPSLSADKSEVKQGSVIVFKGYAAPSAGLAFNLTGQGTGEYSASSNIEGKFSLSVPAQDLALGSYQMRAKAIVGSVGSAFSRGVDFIVGNKDVETQVFGKCPQRADFNNDCRVNLVDFSILAYWFDRAGPPADIDLNSDGVVDLIDFSILAYYWTG